MKKFFDTDGYKNHGRTLGWGGGPDSDWRVLFGFFVILVFVIVVYAGFSFWNAWQGGFGSEIVDKSESPIDEAQLKRTADFYRQRQVEFETITKIPETTPDPSL